MIAQKNFEQQLESEMRQGKERSEIARLRRAKGATEQMYNPRTCRRDKNIILDLLYLLFLVVIFCAIALNGAIN